MACRGVDSVRGLRVVSTGWVHVAGGHIVRRDLAKLIKRRGGTLQLEFSGSTNLVILGDYRDHQIQDDREGGTDALEQLSRARRDRWPHVHLVMDHDLDLLLAGELVRCRQIPRGWGAMKKHARTSTRRGHL